MLRKTKLVLGMMLLSMVLFCTPGARADEEGFSLINQTGVTLHAVYVAPHSSADWEDADELLQGRTLSQGQQLDVSFNSQAGVPNWDLRVEDSDGNSLEFSGLNLASATEVTLGSDNKAYIK